MASCLLCFCYSCSRSLAYCQRPAQPAGHSRPVSAPSTPRLFLILSRQSFLYFMHMRGKTICEFSALKTLWGTGPAG